MCHSFLIVYYWNDREFLTLPNQIRSMSSEEGHIFPAGLPSLRKVILTLMDDCEAGLAYQFTSGYGGFIFALHLVPTLPIGIGDSALNFMLILFRKKKLTNLQLFSYV